MPRPESREHRKFIGKIFDLYSIPVFDRGEPDLKVVRVPSIVSMMAIAGACVTLHGADLKADPGWRALPLVTDGKVDSN